MLVAGGPAVAALGAVASTGILDGPQAVAFAVAAALFQLEEVLRRVLMAALRFWPSSSSTAPPSGPRSWPSRCWPPPARSRWGRSSSPSPSARASASSSPPSCCPCPSAGSSRSSAPAFRQVLSFGGWRGAQVALTPLGAHRQPARRAERDRRRRARRGRGGPDPRRTGAARRPGPRLLPAEHLRPRPRPRRSPSCAAGPAGPASPWPATAVLVGAGVALLAQLIAPVVIGRDIHVDVVTVIGWAVFAAATATMQPFTSLAVARGHQRAVLVVRASTSRSASACSRWPWACCRPRWPSTPFILALGPVLGGVLVRVVVLRTPAPSLAETS